MNDLTCEQAIEYLNAAVDGEALPDSLQVITDRHLESCADCARAARRLSSVHRLLFELETEGLPAAKSKMDTADRERSIARRRRSFAIPRAGRKGLGGLPASLLGAAAVLVGVASAYFLFRQGPANRSPGNGTRDVATRSPVHPDAETSFPVEEPTQRQETTESLPVPVLMARPPQTEKSSASEAPATDRDLADAARQPQQLLRVPLTAGAIGRESPSQATDDLDREIAQTAGPLATLTWLSGTVKYARGKAGRWARAVTGVLYLPEDRIETRAGMAQLRVGDGSRICLGPRTILQFHKRQATAPNGVAVLLEKGEIFVEDIDKKIRVVTAEGTFTPVGTRFGVRRSSSTTIVIVEEGTVEAQSTGKDAKAIRVEAGYQTRVRTHGPPSKPLRANLARVMTWTRAFRPAVVHREGFETTGSGNLPTGWRSLHRPDLQFESTSAERHGGRQALRIADQSVQKQGKIWLELTAAMRSQIRGKRIRVSVWLKALGKPSPRAYLGVNVGPAGMYSKHFTVDPTWRRYEIQHTIPSQPDRPITLYVCTTATELTGAVLVDDFQVEILRP